MQYDLIQRDRDLHLLAIEHEFKRPCGGTALVLDPCTVPPERHFCFRRKGQDTIRWIRWIRRIRRGYTGYARTNMTYPFPDPSLQSLAVGFCSAHAPTRPLQLHRTAPPASLTAPRLFIRLLRAPLDFRRMCLYSPRTSHANKTKGKTPHWLSNSCLPLIGALH